MDTFEQKTCVINYPWTKNFRLICQLCQCIWLFLLETFSNAHNAGFKLALFSRVATILQWRNLRFLMVEMKILIKTPLSPAGFEPVTQEFNCFRTDALINWATWNVDSRGGKINFDCKSNFAFFDFLAFVARRSSQYFHRIEGFIIGHTFDFITIDRERQN